jgi:hypothetical protein
MRVMRGGRAAPHHPGPFNKSVIPTRSEESLAVNSTITSNKSSIVNKVRNLIKMKAALDMM